MGKAQPGTADGLLRVPGDSAVLDAVTAQEQQHLGSHHRRGPSYIRDRAQRLRLLTLKSSCGGGPASRPKLSDVLFAVLEEELAKGPVAHGWPDQRWTLARTKTLIGRRFHKSMTVSGISQMLRRRGWSHQVPARRAVERDEEAVAGRVKEVWPRLEPPRRRSGPGPSSRTRPDSR
ncbi:winged helix-turn-helix domain-containing protein [Streptomyces goshikiensis]|uniref:winged helix-turn-helix domain-containing protein n=1 Tax=Streptomyces goshikiensis TaxID=1942 RepID=UPI0036C5EAEE